MGIIKLVHQDMLFQLRQSDIQKPVRQLYDQYFEGVTAHVKSNGGNYEDGADIFQEAVLVLIEKVKTGQFRGESSIKTFLLAIARNLWLFELRTRNRRSNREVIYMDGEDKQVEITGSFFNKKNTQGLEHLLHEIGETCKKILKGYYYENKSMKELLDQFNYTNEQVLRNRKSKCMKKLKTLLTENDALLNNLKTFSLYEQ